MRLDLKLDTRLLPAQASSLRGNSELRVRPTHVGLRLGVRVGPGVPKSLWHCWQLQVEVVEVVELQLELELELQVLFQSWSTSHNGPGSSANRHARPPARRRAPGAGGRRAGRACNALMFWILFYSCKKSSKKSRRRYDGCNRIRSCCAPTSLRQGALSGRPTSSTGRRETA